MENKEDRNTFRPNEGELPLRFKKKKKKNANSFPFDVAESQRAPTCHRTVPSARISESSPHYQRLFPVACFMPGIIGVHLITMHLGLLLHATSPDLTAKPDLTPSACVWKEAQPTASMRTPPPPRRSEDSGSSPTPPLRSTVDVTPN